MNKEAARRMIEKSGVEIEEDGDVTTFRYGKGDKRREVSVNVAAIDAIGELMEMKMFGSQKPKGKVMKRKKLRRVESEAQMLIQKLNPLAGAIGVGKDSDAIELAMEGVIEAWDIFEQAGDAAGLIDD